MGWNEYAENLGLANRVTEPAVRQAMEELSIPIGSRGVDVGCGIGQHTLGLAELVSPHGKVTGLDISPDNLAVARGLIARSPISRRVQLIQGDLLHLPFHDGAFDWAWCADTLWPVAVCDDPVAGIGELARVVRPGGIVAILYWSSQNLLPGYPALEARLNSAFATTAPYLSGVSPQQHFLRALGWLREAGLEQPAARSYVAEVQAPLSPEMREAVAYLLSMMWGDLEPHVSRDDWDSYQQLCRPDSPRFIPDSVDYYGFLTYTLFYGRAVARKD